MLWSVSACEVNKVFEHVMQCDFRNTKLWTLNLGLAKPGKKSSCQGDKVSQTINEEQTINEVLAGKQTFLFTFNYANSKHFKSYKSATLLIMTKQQC